MRTIAIGFHQSYHKHYRQDAESEAADNDGTGIH